MSKASWYKGYRAGLRVGDVKYGSPKYKKRVKQLKKKKPRPRGRPPANKKWDSKKGKYIKK